MMLEAGDILFLSMAMLAAIIAEATIVIMVLQRRGIVPIWVKPELTADEKLVQALRLIAVGQANPREFAASTLRELGYAAYPVKYPPDLLQGK